MFPTLKVAALRAALAILAGIFTAPSYALPDARVLAAAKRCESKAKELLQELVQIDSGTGDVAGLAAMGAILKTELERLGASVESVPAVAPAVGDNVVATLTGTGKGHILLIAHMDTVFPHGTVALRPYKVVDTRGIGPGAGDDKAGIVTAVCALRILHELNYRGYGQITLILNSNEEPGSVGTRDLIRAKAKQSDAAINLERGVPPDSFVVARKGSAIITIEVIGRAAHSGLEPEKGRNAIVEASHQAIQLGSLASSEKETTVNVTMIQGGNAINVIPDHAVVKADVRAFTPQEFDRVETGLQKLAGDTVVPDVQVKASLTRNFPPWPRAASTEALLSRAQKLYAEIGGKLSGVQVGSSADVAFAAETATPAIDGAAILGGGAHSVDDHADLSSIVPRVYLLTRLLMDLGRKPPIKARPLGSLKNLTHTYVLTFQRPPTQ
jgi:glutamate carboxypeptidase